MGLISLPIMLRYGYDRRVRVGVIAASGTLAQIIPPSLVLIVMADQLGRSVGDMYAGALIPGLVLTGMYAAFFVIVHHPPRRPRRCRSRRTLGSGVDPLLVALGDGGAVMAGLPVFIRPRAGMPTFLAPCHWRHRHLSGRGAGQGRRST